MGGLVGKADTVATFAWCLVCLWERDDNRLFSNIWDTQREGGPRVYVIRPGEGRGGGIGGKHSRRHTYWAVEDEVPVVLNIRNTYCSKSVEHE